MALAELRWVSSSVPDPAYLLREAIVLVPWHEMDTALAMAAQYDAPVHYVVKGG